MDLDKAPYFVTLALALFGWSANQVDNRIVDAPTLEYRVQTPTEVTAPGSAPYREQRIVLTNLTRKTTFDDLSLMLISRKGSPLIPEHLQLRPIAPAFEGDESWSAEGGRATFTVPKLHPGASVIVVAAYRGEHSPVFRIKTRGTVFATRTNWETWFVRNEMRVLLVLAALWAGVILFYAYRNWLSYRSTLPRLQRSSIEIPKEPI